MNYIIYSARNTATGDEYIGVTRQGMAKRRKQHIYDATKGKKPGCHRFARAIRKYGVEAFVWSEVLNNLDYSSAMRAEQRFIAERGPAYNITKGGGGALGIVHSAEARAKLHKPVLCLEDNRCFSSVISAAEHYGTSQSAIGKVISGRRLSAAGKHFVRSSTPMFDDDLREIILIEMADRFVVQQAKAGVANRRRVICEPGCLSFASATEAAAHFNIASTYVAELCRKAKPHKSLGVSFMWET